MSRNNSHDMKAARRQARAAGTCPSCGSAAGPLPGGQDTAWKAMAHAPACELAAALAAVSGEHGTDAGYFAAHPGVRSFTRPITPAELTEQVLGYPHDPPPSPLTTVLVTSLGPSLRARCFFDSHPAASAN